MMYQTNWTAFCRRMVFFVLFLHSLAFAQALTFAEDNSIQQCNQWFYNTDLSKSPQCLTECVNLPTDSTTSHCPKLCRQFCNSPLPRFKENRGRIRTFFSNDDAVLLAIRHPFKMYQAYQLSVKAREICYYHFSTKPKKYDACRHFVWSGLLYKQFGFWFSEQILFIQEQSQEAHNNQPKWQTKMDMANNHLGLTAAKYLLTTDQFSEVNLIKSFYQQLTDRSIIIIQ